MLRQAAGHVRRNGVGYLALFVALSGTSYAVAAGSVGSRQIRDNSVRSNDIRDGNVRAKDVGTIRGTFDVIGRTDFVGDIRTGAASFGFTLGSVPAAHVLAPDDAATAECPGSADLPKAAPGQLCVYEESHFASGGIGISAARFGFTYTVASDVKSVDIPFGASGAWAVTPQ
jgi:hypothetical protein